MGPGAGLWAGGGADLVPALLLLFPLLKLGPQGPAPAELLSSSCRLGSSSSARAACR